MSFPKEFLRPVQIWCHDGYDEHSPQVGGGDWNAWFHRFVEGTESHQNPKPAAMAVIEKKCGEVVLLPMSKYDIKFTDRGS